MGSNKMGRTREKGRAIFVAVVRIPSSSEYYIISKHIRDAGGLGRGIPILSDSFFSHRILEAWFF
jgi:hypothetical protein